MMKNVPGIVRGFAERIQENNVLQLLGNSGTFGTSGRATCLLLVTRMSSTGISMNFA